MTLKRWLVPSWEGTPDMLTGGDLSIWIEYQSQDFEEETSLLMGGTPQGIVWIKY